MHCVLKLDIFVGKALDLAQTSMKVGGGGTGNGLSRAAVLRASGCGGATLILKHHFYYLE
jgi:hypothetical protein